MKTFKRQGGFTILEVMVVLAILGLLASFVAGNLLGNQDDAKLQKAAIDVKTIESNLQMYKLKTGYYPTTEQGLEALVTKPEVEPIPRSYPAEGFLQSLPLDPWDEPYQLVYPGEMGVIDVYSKGPDRQADTDDDLGNWTDETENR